MSLQSLALVLLMLPSAAVAQTHFCIGGDLDHMAATDVAACKTKMSNIRQAVKQHGAPSGWHFVVVCDETGWTDFASFSGVYTSARKAALKSADFHTDRDLGWTFIRGSRLSSEPAQATMVLASILKDVPAPAPGPQPLPNLKRSLPQTTLTVAETRVPADQAATETAGVSYSR